MMDSFASVICFDMPLPKPGAGVVQFEFVMCLQLAII